MERALFTVSYIDIDYDYRNHNQPRWVLRRCRNAAICSRNTELDGENPPAPSPDVIPTDAAHRISDANK